MMDRQFTPQMLQRKSTPGEQERRPGQSTQPDDDLISVVIPNYNGQDTIERAVVSVLSQSHVQTQVIVVDDCSTDDSVALLRHGVSDPRLQIKVHEKNRMIGAARNTGISMSTGSYIFFLDSDDVLLPNSLAALLIQARKSNADIIQGGTQRLSATGDSFMLHKFEFSTAGGLDGLSYFSDHRFAGFAWNKLYHRSIFEGEAGIRFPADYMHEDVPFSMQCAFKARHIASIETPIICYIENKESVTQKIPTRFNLESYLALHMKLADLCQDFNLYDDKNGMLLATKIINAHGGGDILRKFIQCRDQMGQPHFEEILSEVGFSMAGRYGMAATSLIGGLTTLLHEAQQVKPAPQSKDPFRSIKRFIKKRYNRAP